MNLDCSIQFLILGILVQCLLGKDCREVQCSNNGLCVKNSNETFSCQCLQGYTGPFCKLTSRNCDSSVCLDNGKCVQNILNNKITCVCNPGYYGIICQNSNLCLNSKCQNGGTCFPIAGISYFCQCPSGYTGSRCEKYDNIKTCEFNVCKNNGQCTIDPSGLIKCKCPTGFIGTACEIDTSICETKNCNNKGVCVTAFGGDYLCLCNPGFGGKDCELNDVCEENLCQNDGLCQTVGKDKYKCTCPSQFVGDNCEYKICEVSRVTELNITELSPSGRTLRTTLKVVKVQTPKTKASQSVNKPSPLKH